MNVLPIEKQWLPVFDVWVPFTKRAPQLAISSSPKALTNFLGVYRERLMDSGALSKAANRRWMAHREWFPVAAFALWLGRDPVQAIAEHKDMLAARDAQAAQMPTRRTARVPASAEVTT